MKEEDLKKEQQLNEQQLDEVAGGKRTTPRGCGLEE
jgi:hypothetical protein